MNNHPSPSQSPSQMENIIEKSYKNLSYLDNYFIYVLAAIILILILYLLCAYFYVQMNIQSIKDDWINQRCNPKIIPFAGFIKREDNETINDATKKNLEYCTQSSLKNMMGTLMQPLTYAIYSMSSVVNNSFAEVNDARSLINNMRENVANILKEVMGRLMNIMIPIQQIIISFKDMMSKIQGVMTTSLYTSLGTYYGLKSLLGSIVEILIKCLIILAGMIIVMWIMPFTWGIASAMTGIFIGVSVPLILMIAFMTDKLHITSDFKLPSLPKRPSCFDENTEFIVIRENVMQKIPIKDIKIGDIMEDGGIVTVKMKLLRENNKMFLLNGVYVTGEHYVYIGGDENNDAKGWLKVCNHPNSIQINCYNKRIVYCLNTNTKRLYVNNTIFSDWDDILTMKQELTLMKHIHKLKIPINYENLVSQKYLPYELFRPSQHVSYSLKLLGDLIHGYIDKGYDANTLIKTGEYLYKNMHELKLGQIISGTDSTNGLRGGYYSVSSASSALSNAIQPPEYNYIYGIVEILPKTDPNTTTPVPLYNLLTTQGNYIIKETKSIISKSLNVKDFNNCLDAVLLSHAESSA